MVTKIDIIYLDKVNIRGIADRDWGVEERKMKIVVNS